VTWLAAVARNRALDRLRSKGRRFAGMDEAAEIADMAPLADLAMETSETERRLADCLAGLDERAAGAIKAAFFGGQTYESLAKTADMPLGSMKSLIRRGLIRLKACLEL
jgi:RNA polymerase sigma-70 factor (ECF subfamily)